MDGLNLRILLEIVCWVLIDSNRALQRSTRLAGICYVQASLKITYISLSMDSSDFFLFKCIVCVCVHMCHNVCLWISGQKKKIVELVFSFLPLVLGFKLGSPVHIASTFS